MQRLTTLASIAAVAATAMAAPQFATAQSQRSYGSGDVCRAEQRAAANRGTATGAILGAIVGGSVAGNGAKTEGAVLGAGLGAVAGHQIAKRNVRCVDYPRRVSARRDCRWVNEYYNGRNHGFEVCRNRDGVWRPSGRG